MKLHVKNLPTATGVEQVKTLFTPYGEVTRIHMIRDESSGKTRSYVDLAQGAEKAIEDLNNKDFNGNILEVSQAKEKLGAIENTLETKDISSNEKVKGINTLESVVNSDKSKN